MKKLIITLFCIAILVSLSIPFALPVAAATTIYVPDHYSTIQAAVNAASPGDTIIVRDGIYTENVNVYKSVNIHSQNGAASTIVQAADPNDYVFEVMADYVNISGFTVKGATGAGAIHVYSSSNTTILGNNCIFNGGAGGISLWSSNNNTVSRNNCDSNSGGGIYLDNSTNNVIHDNKCSFNSDFGISLNSSSSNNTIFANHASGSYFGICFNYLSSNNRIYLNNFSDNTIANVSSFNSSNAWNSPEQITYTFNGNTYANYLGNYWSDYTGGDSNGDGIGDTPYVIATPEQDNYPLREPFENYHEFFYIGKYTATAYAYPEEADSTFGSFKSARTMITIQKPDSSTISVNVKKKFLDAMKMNGGGLVNSNPQSYVHLVQWTLSGNIFKEIEEVVGSQLIPIVAYQSIAKCPTDTKIQYGDEGFFTLGRTGTSYEYSVDDTCPACCKKGNGIDFWLGVGKAAYSEAFNWGKKTVDLYVYK